MSGAGSITHWLGLMREGNQDAARQLWDCYFPQLVALARRWLAGQPRGPADEEDVALSAFGRFCHEARQGRFPQLDSRDDLWRVLAALTAHKAIDLRRSQTAQKRGGGMSPSAQPVDGIAAREPWPDLAVQMAEQVRVLLDRLGDLELRALALLKLEGQTNEEIAALLGCVPRTVERRLRTIRSLWEAAHG